jgi:uncharacterized BrkB/YihY/UPF0761 family membrane protein
VWFTSLYRWFRYPLTFTGQVFQRFQANQGTLLAGAMAYNALLSLVPLAILLLVALSQVVSEAQLLEVLHRYLEQLAPNKSDVIFKTSAPISGASARVGLDHGRNPAIFQRCGL